MTVLLQIVSCFWQKKKFAHWALFYEVISYMFKLFAISYHPVERGFNLCSYETFPITIMYSGGNAVLFNFSQCRRSNSTIYAQRASDSILRGHAENDDG